MAFHESISRILGAANLGGGELRLTFVATETLPTQLQRSWPVLLEQPQTMGRVKLYFVAYRRLLFAVSPESEALLLRPLKQN